VVVVVVAVTVAVVVVVWLFKWPYNPRRARVVGCNVQVRKRLYD